VKVDQQTLRRQHEVWARMLERAWVAEKRLPTDAELSVLKGLKRFAEGKYEVEQS
jgi:hypothetical protein